MNVYHAGVQWRIASVDLLFKPCKDRRLFNALQAHSFLYMYFKSALYSNNVVRNRIFARVTSKSVFCMVCM